MSRVPRLSIGLPVHNGAQYLAAALDALLGQSYEDFELIISDNASTDATADICHRYAAREPRIRYVRQPRNIGAAPNHNVVVHAARGELFKWAGHDDLYSPNLLERCVAALDEHPDVVLVSCWSALIDGSGHTTRPVVEYPPATDSPRAPERFRGVLFGLGGDDDYGVIRADVLRRTPLSGSHYHADRSLVAELALHGRFLRVPETLYLRRDLPDRAGRPEQTTREWCVTHDPRRADRLRHPTIRLLAEYVWAFADAIRRAPLTGADKRACYRVLAGYLANRVLPDGMRPTSVVASQAVGATSVRPRGMVNSSPSRGSATSRRRPATTGPRVGFFGLLGSGNFGNDGSFEAVLGFLRAEHPDAVLDARCAGPERVTSRYAIPATALHWYDTRARSTSGTASPVAKVLGKVLDAFRTLSWVRRHDVVIVPGMGVLEATLPLRPWGFPYALFLLCASGRLVGTRVALVSVGADVVHDRPTRWLITAAARLAHYRSYRDALSRDAMQRMGADTTRDEVYPDLAFALPVPPVADGVEGIVGVGLMAYYGGNGDRGRAEEIHTAYVAAMQRFVRWLLDEGRRVRLLGGDQVDEAVVREIIADVRAHRPTVDASKILADPVHSLDDVMAQLATVETVVATRYHNVLCALKLSKPTLSIGYAAKNDVLMAEMGLGEFCQSARSVEVDLLIEQFRELENRREQLRHAMTVRNQVNVRRLEHQFAVLSATLFPVPAAVSARGGARGVS